MENKIPKEYIINIVKATSQFTLKNGPIKEMIAEGKLTESDVKRIQSYMENHMAYLYNVLLEESNLKKFDLIVNTMNKFYVNDSEALEITDDGFDKFFESLFPTTSNITFK